LFDHFGNGLIRTTDPENLSVDTVFILLSQVFSELWPQNVISVMAVLICILPKMVKATRVASSGFLISTLQIYKNCKKLTNKYTNIKLGICRHNHYVTNSDSGYA